MQSEGASMRLNETFPNAFSLSKSSQRCIFTGTFIDSGTYLFCRLWLEAGYGNVPGLIVENIL